VSHDLESDRLLLERVSTAEKVADILRTRILQGYFAPGDRLVEGAVGGALGISRNTLREAFRLLSHEGLLVQELNRGVFVRVPALDDVVDIYRARRLVESQAVRGLTPDTVLPGVLDRMTACLRAADEAANAQQWLGLGTANIQFHLEIAALAGSPRIDQLMRRLLAELRLVFHVMDNPRRFHEPYVARNRELFELIRAGDGLAAERSLATYLDDAQRQLLETYARARPGVRLAGTAS
jgi:DNA-binding GntR family transcriptional regulator